MKKDYSQLIPGQKYVVIKSFTDFDKGLHAEGETWTFQSASFLPYEDGLSLFVRDDHGIENIFRLQWREDQQSHIINAFMDYVNEVITSS